MQSSWWHATIGFDSLVSYQSYPQKIFFLFRSMEKALWIKRADIPACTPIGTHACAARAYHGRILCWSEVSIELASPVSGSLQKKPLGWLSNQISFVHSSVQFGTILMAFVLLCVVPRVGFKRVALLPLLSCGSVARTRRTSGMNFRRNLGMNSRNNLWGNSLRIPGRFSDGIRGGIFQWIFERISGRIPVRISGEMS